MMQTYLSVSLGALLALLFHFWAERHPGRWQRFRCAYLYHEVEADPAGGLRCWRCLHYFPPIVWPPPMPDPEDDPPEHDLPEDFDGMGYRCDRFGPAASKSDPVAGYLQMGLNAGMEPNELRPAGVSAAEAAVDAVMGGARYRYPGEVSMAYAYKSQEHHWCEDIYGRHYFLTAELRNTAMNSEAFKQNTREDKTK